jgi:translation initiation factor 2 subunit 1
LAKELESFVRDKIKPKQVEIIEKVTLQTYAENGLELIKEAFSKAKEADQTIHISYLGGGTYRLLVVAKDYKKAESVIADIQERMGKVFNKKGKIEFARQEA